MKNAIRNPVVIAIIVAVISMAALFVIDYANLNPSRPESPPGTTFRTVNDAGATVTPTAPESPVKLPSPAPVGPPNRPN
jgi:hypothetical protein